MLIALWFIIGIVSGYIIGRFALHKEAKGEIVVTEDEDGTYLFLQLKRTSDVTESDQILLNVKHKKPDTPK